MRMAAIYSTWLAWSGLRKQIAATLYWQFDSTGISPHTPAGNTHDLPEPFLKFRRRDWRSGLCQQRAAQKHHGLSSGPTRIPSCAYVTWLHDCAHR